MKVSVVSNHTQTKNLVAADVEEIFKAIGTGGKQTEQILKIRKMVSDKVGEDLVKKEKAKLPAILFNGTFSERNNEGLIESSGLMILDFDNDVPNMEKFKDFIYAMFKSPSGTGVKILFRIPIVKSDAEYKTYFYAVQKQIPQIDPSGKDIARLCYFSLDEEIYVQTFENVKVWTEKIESVVPLQEPVKGKKTLHTNWQHVNTAMQMISNSMVGNRHETMLRAGRLLGGYISGGDVDESESKTIIQNHIQLHSPDDYQDHIRAFNDAIENGKKSPLTKKELKEIIDEVEKLGTIHLTLEDVRDEMDFRFENGLEKGYKTGWVDLDKHYTILLGSTTYLYSSPFAGKSQVLNEVLVNLSRFYGMRHALFSPETGNAAEIFQELAQIYHRKDFKKGIMSDLEKEEAYEFLKKYFIVLDGDFFDKELTIQDVCDYVSLLERKYDLKIHTLTIDPYNELKHHYGSRQDLELETELKYVRRSAKNNERHIFIVTHVRDQDGQYDKEGGFTYYHLPTFRDVAGGQTWSRKGMMMMAVWRPVVIKRDNDSDEVIVNGKTIKANQTIIQVQKAKPKGYGSIGEVNLYYQWKEHSFKDDRGNYAIHPDKQFEVIQNKLIPETNEEPYPF